MGTTGRRTGMALALPGTQGQVPTQNAQDFLCVQIDGANAAFQAALANQKALGIVADRGSHGGSSQGRLIAPIVAYRHGCILW